MGDYLNTAAEALSMGFIQRALLAGTMLGIFSGIISVFIVLRRISFLGSGISHAAFGGVAIGFVTGINPVFTALAYSIATAIGIEQISARGRVSEDTAIGIFFASSMALGIVLLGLSSSYNVDLYGYLFGSILAVTHADMMSAVFMTLILTSAIVLITKELHFITFNEELAYASGIRVRLIKFIFMICMAIAIVTGIKLVGVILVSALLVIPGATANLLTNSLFKMIIVSSLITLFSVVTGIFTSYLFNLAPGGTIVLIMSACFAAAYLSRRNC
ncbi:MAG: metal ABC transporter permease [Dissulfurispiraceae bacterium]|jgi:zinc transport system permease protein|nr:metal ABC transporter permease [Dissulfurispiraceae bacterium]